jgi:hypothetical protein
MLKLSDAVACAGTSSAQRVGVSSAEQGQTVGWLRPSRTNDMMEALDLLSHDPIPIIASEAKALRARYAGKSRVLRMPTASAMHQSAHQESLSTPSPPEYDLTWSSSGKMGCYHWGVDSCNRDRNQVADRRIFGTEGVQGRGDSICRQIRAATGCSYVPKFGVKSAPLTGSRAVRLELGLPSKMGTTQHVMYPHLVGHSNPAYRAGALAVGLCEEDAEIAKRDKRALWAQT